MRRLFRWAFPDGCPPWFRFMLAYVALPACLAVGVLAVPVIYAEDGPLAAGAAVGLLLGGLIVPSVVLDWASRWGVRSRLANRLLRLAARLDPPVAFPNAANGGFRINAGGMDIAHVSPGQVQTPDGSIEFGERAVTRVAPPRLNLPFHGAPDEEAISRVAAVIRDTLKQCPAAGLIGGGQTGQLDGATEYDVARAVLESGEVIPFPQSTRFTNAPLTTYAPPTYTARAVSARTMRLQDLYDRYRPGSGDWSWAREDIDLGQRECALHKSAGCYQRSLEHYLAEGGELGPVLLGDDGRVHDGHHRILAYLFLRRPNVPYITYADLKEDPHG